MARVLRQFVSGAVSTTTVGLSVTEKCISPLLNAHTLALRHARTHARTRLNYTHSPEIIKKTS